MTPPINNRSEILFLYDVRNSNPNGDPLDENRPRMDEETDKILVTDVRLKRTIRDYLKDYEDQNIFIFENRKEDGNLETRKERVNAVIKENDLDKKDLDKVRDKLFKKYIDLRIFGATIGIKGGTITQNGPVQFNFGTSYNKTTPKFLKGTTVMPAEEGKEQGTFTQVYVVPYALIGFNGIINENAGKDTKLSQDDVNLLLKGLWHGTKNLITRSKTGQIPRFLLKVNYKEDNYHIGNLDQFVEFNANKDEYKIRTSDDYSLDFSKLMRVLRDNKEKIESIEYCLDKNIEVNNFDLDEFNAEKLNFS